MARGFAAEWERADKTAYDDVMAQATLESRPQAAPSEPQTQKPRLWNVVLLDDDDHSYEYVIRMVQELFHASKERAFKIAESVDVDGRAVCMTTHLELAELKHDQIRCFGPDKLIAGSAGAMSAILEPAEFGGDDDFD